MSKHLLQCGSQILESVPTRDSISKRPVLGRPHNKPTNDHYLLLSFRRRRNTTVSHRFSNRFPATERKISSTSMQRHRLNRGMYTRKPRICVCSSHSIAEVCPIMFGQKACHLDQ
ncbi:hypothetical protein AVEN_227517-1 [Araneus ventricosus]|uniref:Uncharacterized protein n=1 Tax=Araneus ventricosus TaxID=182803 RepID=A0A4Y2C5U6_ARAVE|nr:hypothetical protein AVEN_227517-1 [Araneus ventricosus]